jgi:hypothetical protein
MFDSRLPTRLELIPDAPALLAAMSRVVTRRYVQVRKCAGTYPE